VGQAVVGIQKEVAAFVAGMQLPKGFSVCELGDQGMCGTARQLAKDWYLQLGCGRYVSIDGNGRGTLTADLNLPVKLDPFDLVTDFGTGEHIFDQAQVWRTLHDLTKRGGHIAFDRPAQGYQKHCYYLVNDCLFHDIADANGYDFIWMERQTMPRGELVRGCYRKMNDAPFRIPQQGRYRSSLVIQ